MGTYVALLLVLVALVFQPGVEGISCRRPRPMLHGRYEYQYSTLLGEEEYLPEGFVVRVLCNPPAKLIREEDEYIQCEPNGQWSGKPLCRAPTACRPPGGIEHGYVRVRGRWPGGRAIYRCNPGFYLLGRNVLTCRDDGAWTSSAPECVNLPSCQAPEIAGGHNLTATLIAGEGHVIDGLYTEQSVCAAECPVGFVPSRNYNLTCLGGEWVSSGEIPECLSVTCHPPSLAPIPHGRSNVENRTYFVGEAVNYRCDYGYRLAGKSWQVCNHRNNRDTDGVWNVHVPRCVVVTCPYPGREHLKNGQVFFSSSSMTVGTKMTLRCNSIYTLLGSSERVCQADGTWNGTITSCHRNEYECKALGNPIHGSIYSKSGELEVNPQFRIGETVYFRCDDPDRYEMVGSKQRFCTRNEEWTGEMPRCLERHEFDPAQSVNQGLGETFDQIAIEGSSWASSNDTNRAGSRRRRSINLAVKGIDIWFAFDASSSIGEKNFELSKDFAKSLVKKISPSGSLGGARISAVWFSTGVGTAFNLSDSTTEAVLHDIDQIQYEGLGTNIMLALTVVRTLVSQSIGSQAESYKNRKVLFLITDGQNNMGGEPVSTADELKESYDVDIHCIGLGPEVNKEKLASIASLPHAQHIFFLRDYTTLDETVRNITSSTRDYSQCGKAGTNNVQAGKRKANSGEYPWMAAIYSTDSHDVKNFICGGTLISRNWILTAAHCLLGQNKTDLTVLLGLTNRDYDEHRRISQKFEVAEAIMHADFNQSGLYQNDIALLKLDDDAEFGTFVRTVCLPPRQVKAARELEEGTATVTGWGKKDTGDPRYEMKEIMMMISDRAECGNSLSNADTQLCAGLPNRPPGEGVCGGDSGGPLVVLRETTSPAYVQLGVVSLSTMSERNCATSYDVYTRVTPYLDWIANTTREHE